MEFEPHSQMFDLINLGIELDLILDDDQVRVRENLGMVAEEIEMES